MNTTDRALGPGRSIAFAAVFMHAALPVLQATTFSISGSGTGISPSLPDAILEPGGPVDSPVAPATIEFPGTILVPGTGGDPVIEIDALSYNTFLYPDNVSTVWFSVAPGSVGISGSPVFAESGGGPSLSGDEPTDVFGVQIWCHVQPCDPDYQAADGNGSTAPALGLPEPFFEDLDALGSFGHTPSFGPDTVVFFSVDRVTAAGPYLGASPADIFAAPATPGFAWPGEVPTLHVSAEQLGLVPDDDIDALHWWDGGLATTDLAFDWAVFSLAPGSPTLARLGASPADILYSGVGNRQVRVLIPAEDLGLLPTDDINALYIPEPSISGLLIIATVAWGFRRRRR